MKSLIASTALFRPEPDARNCHYDGKAQERKGLEFRKFYVFWMDRENIMSVGRVSAQNSSKGKL
jgi:hypothetical protein